MGTRTASGVLTINTITDGVSADYIHEYYYKWTNSYTSYGSATDGWSRTQPDRGNYLYLWRKDIYKEYNETTNTYDQKSISYLCQNGENGTGFQPKGAAVDVPQASTSGYTASQYPNKFLMTTSSPYLFMSDGTTWQAQNIPALSDSYIVNKTGDAQDGHGYSWTGTSWLDLGVVRGANGESSYIHMAWCNVKGTGTDWTGQSTGFTTNKAASVEYKYLGTLVNNDSGTDPDVTHAGEYTWNEIQGKDAYILSANLSHVVINTDSDGYVVDTNSRQIIVNMYKGNNSSALTTTISNVSYPSGVIQDYSTSNSIYFHCPTTTNLSTPKVITIQATADSVTKTINIEIVGSVQGEQGDDAYSFDVLPNIMSWATDEKGNLKSYSTVSGIARSFKAATQQTTTNITGASGLPLGFTLEKTSGNGFNITPHEYYTDYTYTSSGTTIYVYVMKRLNQYAQDDVVYNSSMMRIGVVSTTSSGGFTATLDAGGTITCSMTGSEYHVTFTAPISATLTLQTGSVSRGASLLLMPETEGKGAIRLDLDNEFDSIQYAGDTQLTASVTSVARLYHGGTQLSSGVTYARDSSSTATGTVNSSTGAISVTALPSNATKGILVVKATYDGVNYYATFTVTKIVDKPKYELDVTPNIIAVNTSTTSGTASVVVRVWKNAIDSSGVTTRTNVQSLGTGLNLFYQIGSYQPAVVNKTTGYVNGSCTISSIPYTVAKVVVWLTDSTGSVSSQVTGLLDKETIPLAAVQNGAQGEQGEQGKMGRTIYFAGEISDFDGDTQGYDVTDTQAPYVQTGVDSNGLPICYAFDGENGHYSWSTDPEHYDDPDEWADGESWELMVNDFKYLITQALFSNFAKLGSGIFNGDYMFSQMGTVNGALSSAYQMFAPNFVDREETVVNNTTTLTTSAKTIGTVALTQGQPASFALFFSSYTSGTIVHLQVYNSSGTSLNYGWYGQIVSSDNSFSRVQNPFPYATGTYTVKAWIESGGSADVSSARFSTNGFAPNVVVNWMQGVIRANTGWFKNVVVEGVINNLIQTIDGSNYTNYGSLVSYNAPYTNVFCINPTKVGSYIQYNYPTYIGLPCAYYSGGTQISPDNFITLDELRQCVGKRIYIYTGDNSSMAGIICGRQVYTNTYIRMLVVDTNMVDLTNMPTDGTDEEVAPRYTKYFNYVSNTSFSNYFFVAECKLGRYNNYECIYWELQNSYAKLT